MSGRFSGELDMTPAVTKERDASHLNAQSLFRGPLQKAYLKPRQLHEIMILACVFLPVPWMSVAPAYAVEASGTATIQCGAFSGDPQGNPAWVQRVPYSIAGDQISLSTAVSGETNQWNGTIDNSGHILLTGAGSSGGGAWVMHFTGKWRGAGGTRLAGGYHNVRGMVGHRSCSILL
jgi:hypothetical protein